MSWRNCFLFILACLTVAGPLAEDYVIEDDGVGMSLEELTYVVKYWSPEMQQAAAKDRGDRIELLNMSLSAKKIAAQADKVTRASNPEQYWRNQFLIRNINTKFVVNNYMRELEVPDMSALVEERYLTQKDHYAAIPEERLSSHILVKCAPPECDRRAKQPEVEQILVELQSGAVFEDLVVKYSEDPGSRDQGGKFDRWLQRGTFSNVAPQYHEAVFKIEKLGDYSPVTESTFGFHIIRLDEIRAKSYKPFEAVKAEITADLVKEYRKLAAKEFDARYQLSPAVKMDEKALDELFQQYKTAE
jgi:parvulin-like peptidyl-prolyl isomerase